MKISTCEDSFLWMILVFLLFGFAESGCPEDLPHTTSINQYQGKCYQFVNTEKYWTDAKDYCLENGGSLVMLADSDTNDFITSTLNSLSWKNNGVWIGLNDKGYELFWKWETADRAVHIPLTNTTFTNWARGHPKGFWHKKRDCIRMVRDDDWKWHETFCSTFNWKYKFICQYDYTPTATAEYVPPNFEPIFATKPLTMKQTETTTEMVDSMEELTPDISTQELTPDISTSSASAANSKVFSTHGVLDAREGEMGSSSMLQEAERKKLTRRAIISGTVGTGIVLVALLVIIIIGRRSNKKDDPKTVENPTYEDEISPACESMGGRKHNGHHQVSKPGNLYVETPSYIPNNQDTAEICMSYSDGGYLEPSSLKLKDIPATYLTTASMVDLKSRSDGELKPNSHSIGIELEANGAKVDKSGFGYLPMEGNTQNNQDSATPDETGYEVPESSEHIYAEIPDSLSRNKNESNA